MDTTKKKVFSGDEIEKNVFIINDIDLMIPPHQMEARKEDLSFRYRTLRTKQSTKVPTGHGQVSVKVSIPFIDNQLLHLQRLLVQIRNSPFCYIDNRYLRESIVPDWPYSQNMAFTVTGLQLSNMPNASNAYVLELDLIWFNYFPFMHNYLFREDWQTNWLRTDNANNKSFQTNTIGWKINFETYEKIFGINTLAEVISSNDEILARRGIQDLVTGVDNLNTVDQWSSIQSRYTGGSHKRTIYEMENRHPGVQFDLLPLPGNMMPANIVNQPRYSRIYVRYINFLQRDALWKHFEIDVEKDILDYESATNTTGLYDSIFKVGLSEDGLPVCLSLASNAVPRSLRQKWISKIDSYNHSVNFYFHTYKELRFPQKWLDNVENKKNKVVRDLFERVSAIKAQASAPPAITGPGDEESIPVLGAAYPITSEYGNRIHPIRKVQHFHEGVDFGAPRGTPILAPEAGYISAVIRNSPSAGNFITLRTLDGREWRFMHMDLIDPRSIDAYVSWQDAAGDQNKAMLIPAGRQLGTVGATGGVTGPHLHLEYRINGVHSDPVFRLQQLILDNKSDHIDLDSTALIDNTPYFDYQNLEEPELTDEEFRLEAAKQEATKALELTEDEAQAMMELMSLLDSEGWSYYDEDSSVTNVWKKVFALQIKHFGRDEVLKGEYSELIGHNGIVCTGISGGYQHLVARIPVLSHEYPTQQHLGSVEPEYMFEFAVIDDSLDLEGISSMGQLVQGMRSILQSNSRKFRPITDGWCVAVDTFITRLLGSFYENDVQVYEENGLIGEIKLKKRAIVNNSHDSTVPGNPGLSILNLNIQETNPYERENLVSTSPSLIEKEDARSQVLTAVHQLKFNPEYKDILIPVFFANRSGANLTDPSRPDYGKFGIPKKFSGIPDYSLDGQVLSYSPTDTKKLFVVQEQRPQEFDYFKSLGLQPDYYQGEDGLVVLDSSGLDSYYRGIFDFNSEPYYDWMNPRPTYFPGGSPNPLEASDAEIEAISSLVNPDGRVIELYDISSLLESTPTIGGINIEKFLEYFLLIEGTIQTANRLIAEEQLGGLSKTSVQETLYKLPIESEQWRTWLMYLEEFAKVSNTANSSSAVSQVKEITQRSLNARGASLPALDESKRADITKIANQGFGLGGTNTAGAYDYSVGYLNNLVYYGAGSVISSQISVSDWDKNQHADAIQRLVHRYMSNFPIQLWLTSQIKEKYKYVFGDLLLDSTDSYTPTTENLNVKMQPVHEAFFHNAYSVGNVTAYAIGNRTGFLAMPNTNPVWEVVLGQASPRTAESGLTGVAERAATFIDQLPGYSTIRSLTGGEYRYDPQASMRAYSGIETVPLSVPTFEVSVPTARGLQQAASTSLLNTLPEWVKHQLSNPQVIGKTPNSNFEFPTDQGIEQEKLRYIRNALAKIADEILTDYPVLEMLGLEHLMFRDVVGKSFSGMECYPDLDLPAHPYYGTNSYTYPDFYFWNIYEDADALNPETLNIVYGQMNSVVKNAYDSMKKLSLGDKFDESKESALQESTIADPLLLSTEINPEGTDGQRDGSGPTTSPFAKVKAADAAVKNWNDKAKEEGITARVYGDKPSEYMEGIRLSNTEGLFGLGGGVHYPTRVGPATYSVLKDEFNKTTQMFGSQEGYLGRELNAKNAPLIYDSTKTTNLARPSESAHHFDLESLQHIARDSSKDLISQKMSMKRAFPTFKLFFIEEDEFETRLINFDDFYSYNAVKRIDVFQSRTKPADTAVITLQNIAGTLDGTRRNVVTDLDYFSGDAQKRLESSGDLDASTLSGDPLTAGTSSDQPFGAVVLRPGLNVQLRIGYSNDADSLHVMLSGRIVDVVWNKTGDLAEITVQSFGTELMQVVKGTSRDDATRTFYTTHELLGSMMLEPEVVHFGRWEFGQKFMYGEASDHKLDFTDYSRDGYLGRLPVTSWASNWITNHPYMSTGLAIGVSLGSTFFPYGRFAGWLGQVGSRAGGVASGVGKMMARGGSAAPYVFGKSGYINIASGIAKGFGKTTDDLLSRAVPSAGTITRLGSGATAVAKSASTPRIILLREAARNLDALAAIARNRIPKEGLTSFNSILKTKRAAMKSSVLRANNLDDAVQAVAEVESYVVNTIGKSRWFAKPWVELTGANFLGSVGLRPIGTLLKYYLGTPLAIAGATFGATLALDGIINALYSAGSFTQINAVRKFFARANVQMFLTPQDDNIYPPHPKDYMSLDKTIKHKLTEYGLHVASMTTARSPEFGKQAYRFLFPDEIITKKVEPSACQYQLVNTTIWDVFHEMSLRHPGWIYGIRPYGNDFRYTMFFGIPSQRYWARPASNAFIHRSNELRRYLDSSSGGDEYPINDYEFRVLYGEEAYKEVEELSINELIPPDTKTYLDFGLNLPPQSNSDLGYGESAITDDIATIRAQETEDSFRNAAKQQNMTAIALQEYLRSVQIRFEPFRRYHMFSSERDIVWNGLMGSENAMANAVDVSYFTDSEHEANDSSGAVQTAVFKAHSFIPEHKLRIAPVRWYNCKGYGMAQRYAMGELLHRLKDMYRGEILLLGNPRIRPWDIGILLDTYNDMVGPIEIEQVVHTFSHETGYLTEIKPSAVCFANEISSYPILEAMKLFSMAINDVHKRFTGVTSDTETETSATQAGSIETVANLLANTPGLNYAPTPETASRYGESFGKTIGSVLGPTAANSLSKTGRIAAYNLARMTGGTNNRLYDSFMEERYRNIFEDGATIKNMYGSAPPPEFEMIDGVIDDIMSTTKYVTSGVGIMGAGLTLAGGVVGGGALAKAGLFALADDALTVGGGSTKIASAAISAFIKNPLSLAAGAAIISGLGLSGGSALTLLALNQIEFPSVAFLFGGTALFLQCLRNDAIIVVPVIKNGYPVVAGLGQNDPSMIWNSLRGTLNRAVYDAIEGTTDMLSLYKKYYDSLWERADKIDLWGETDVQGYELTGE